MTPPISDSLKAGESLPARRAWRRVFGGEGNCAIESETFPAAATLYPLVEEPSPLGSCGQRLLFSTIEEDNDPILIQSADD